MNGIKEKTIPISDPMEAVFVLYIHMSDIIVGNNTIS